MTEYWYVKRKSDGLYLTGNGSWGDKSLAQRCNRYSAYHTAGRENAIVVHVTAKPKKRGEPVGWTNRYPDDHEWSFLYVTKEEANRCAGPDRLECFPVYR